MCNVNVALARMLALDRRLRGEDGIFRFGLVLNLLSTSFPAILAFIFRCSVKEFIEI